MISSTIEYALRSMAFLSQTGAQPASSESIAKATQVPHGYLSKIMRDLVCADLVRSFRGPNGGFQLARAAEEISLLDVVNAVDPIRRISRCPMNNPLHINLCPLHRCLDDAMDGVEKRLRAMTLTTLLENAGAAGTCHSLITPAVRGRAEHRKETA